MNGLMRCLGLAVGLSITTFGCAEQGEQLDLNQTNQAVTGPCSDVVLEWNAIARSMSPSGGGLFAPGAPGAPTIICAAIAFHSSTTSLHGPVTAWLV